MTAGAVHTGSVAPCMTSSTNSPACICSPVRPSDVQHTAPGVAFDVLQQALGGSARWQEIKLPCRDALVCLSGDLAHAGKGSKIISSRKGKKQRARGKGNRKSKGTEGKTRVEAIDKNFFSSSSNKTSCRTCPCSSPVRAHRTVCGRIINPTCLRASQAVGGISAAEPTWPTAHGGGILWVSANCSGCLNCTQNA